jgi:8-oxo-dGTP diphosphatase
MKRVDVALAIVLRGSRVLIARRKSTGAFAGFWEFPGGKREPGETIEECLHRELWEELAIRAKPVMSLPPIVHDYPQVQVRLHPYLCLHEAGEPQLIQCQALRWVEPRDLHHFEFPEANAPLIEQIIAALPPPVVTVNTSDEHQATSHVHR